MSITREFDFLIQWHLTERCNLRCSHCYQSGLHGEELSFGELKNALDEISQTLTIWADNYEIAFVPSMNITGGEPFLFENLFETLEYVRLKGFEMYILSNGTLATREKAEQLRELGVKGVQVSIEGPETVHERIRGKGTFASSLRGVNHFLNAGLEVTLNMTLSALNAESFPDIKDLASSLGVQRLGFSRLVPSGRGKDMLNYMLTKDKVKDLYSVISSMRENGLEIVTGDPVASQSFFAFHPEDDDSTPMGGCAAGVSGMTIMPDGTLLPCRRMPIPLGNIRKDSFREIWATSPVLLKLRDKSSYAGKCGKCRRWVSCRGCRAIAYAYSQSRGKADFLADDPQCFL
ncbi:antilisterial bacteriocin subtilosin biosynthesis protein AlbA [bacterium BMS3Abin07]|nr:antilisterial bacteriocin subtilosin biosynthesis protein AlbA [bacterium BMS3Abin07]HDO22541.1 radical SAM protein [Nitrospirota bacterium]